MLSKKAAVVSLTGIIVLASVGAALLLVKSPKQSHGNLETNTVSVNSSVATNQNVASNGDVTEIEPLFPVTCAEEDGMTPPAAQQGWKYIGLTDACLQLPLPDLEPLHGWGTILGNDPSVFGGKNYFVVYKANGSQRATNLAYILPLKADDSVLPGVGKTLASLRGIEKNVGSKDVPVFALPLSSAGLVPQGGDAAAESKSRFYVMDDLDHGRVYLFKVFYAAPDFEKNDEASKVAQMVLGSRPF